MELYSPSKSLNTVARSELCFEIPYKNMMVKTVCFPFGHVWERKGTERKEMDLLVSSHNYYGFMAGTK